MNKFSAAVFILLLFGLLFHNQVMAQVEFGVGPIGGVNFGTVSLSHYNPDNATQSGRRGTMFGVQEEVGFGRRLFFVLQSCYIGKGFRVAGDVWTEMVDLDEVEFAALFKVKFFDGALRPYAFVGPNFGFVISAKEIATFSQSGLPFQHAEEDLKAQTYPDCAIDIGGGAEYNVFPNLSLTADIRYSLGIADLLRWSTYAMDPPPMGKASGFQTLIGAMFHVM